MTIKTPKRSGAFCTESMYATYHKIIRWVIEEENKFKRGKKVQSVIHDMSNKCYTLGYPIQR